MTETPKCPYCGAELEVTHVLVNSVFAAHKLVYTCFCRECGVYTPKRPTPEEALSAALHRAEPEMRPLTLEEVRAHCAKGPDAEPLWAEFKEECAISRWIFAVIPPDVFDRPVLSEWIATDRSEKYGKEWRCWPRKPTPEQIVAEKWEE